MSKINRFKAALTKLLAAFGNVSTDRGVLAWDGEEDLKAGDSVYIEDQDGNRTPAPDGDYITSDAKTIVVADGKVAELRDPEAEVAPEPEPEPEVEQEKAETEMGRVNTDNGELVWEGEGDLEAGREVFVQGDEGLAPAPDGEYRTEDGKTIVVVEGKVSEIRDPEAEVETEPEPDEAEELRKENAELRSQVETLTRKMEEMARTPAAKPAHEEIQTNEAPFKTGNRGKDRIASMMARK